MNSSVPLRTHCARRIGKSYAACCCCCLVHLTLLLPATGANFTSRKIHQKSWNPPADSPRSTHDMLPCVLQKRNLAVEACRVPLQRQGPKGESIFARTQAETTLSPRPRPHPPPAADLPPSRRVAGHLSLPAALGSMRSRATEARKKSDGIFVGMSGGCEVQRAVAPSAAADAAGGGRPRVRV